VAPFRTRWRYFGAMATIQVKNVPPDVHATLRHRAIDARQSLQEYVLAMLVREARRPTVDDVLARIARRDGVRVSIDEINAAIREGRGEP
jgi:hypothetical protein